MSKVATVCSPFNVTSQANFTLDPRDPVSLCFFLQNEFLSAVYIQSSPLDDKLSKGKAMSILFTLVASVTKPGTGTPQAFTTAPRDKLRYTQTMEKASDEVSH